MTYLNGIGGIKPKINFEDNTYQIISVSGNDVQRWQDVRVEILNNVINNKSIELSLRNDDNQELIRNLLYSPSILNKEGDIIQNIGLNVVYPDNSPTIGSINKQPNNQNFKVGDRSLKFKVNDAEKIKTTQSDINNFVGKFLDENETMSDAEGYHKSLFTAMNPDAIAQHFYEQGKADAIKESIAKSKNVNMDPRQQLGEVANNSGIKVRVLGDSSNDFKFKIKKNR